MCACLLHTSPCFLPVDIRFVQLHAPRLCNLIYPIRFFNWAPCLVQSVLRFGRCKASFVAASQTDLLWIDQVDLIAVIDDHDEIRSCLEKTANIEQQVRQGLFHCR